MREAAATEIRRAITGTWGRWAGLPACLEQEPGGAETGIHPAPVPAGHWERDLTPVCFPVKELRTQSSLFCHDWVMGFVLVLFF